MIKPFVGHTVLFHPERPHDAAKNTLYAFELGDLGDQPMAATIVYVWTDRCVNIAGFDHKGKLFQAEVVTLVQQGDEVPVNGHYCEWMPDAKRIARLKDEEARRAKPVKAAV